MTSGDFIRSCISRTYFFLNSNLTCPTASFECLIASKIPHIQHQNHYHFFQAHNLVSSITLTLSKMELFKWSFTIHSASCFISSKSCILSFSLRNDFQIYLLFSKIHNIISHMLLTTISSLKNSWGKFIAIKTKLEFLNSSNISSLVNSSNLLCCA